ncbi:hypothetical protein EJB05_46901, partial [Eragrostis curvula]
MRGIFSNYCDYHRPHLFARPRATITSSGLPHDIDGTFTSRPKGGVNDRLFGWDSVLDHCNGLVLYDHHHQTKLYVCNPATRRWALLPSPLRKPECVFFFRYTGYYYLAYDPSVSLHYEVFLVPEVPEDGEASSMGQWPPPVHTLQVFSSRTQQWEDRAFVRQGEPVGTVAEARTDSVEPVCCGPQRRYAEYWRGALYVHCRGAYVMRLSPSEDKYQVIKTPTSIKENEDAKPYLGRSESGVYYVALAGLQLRVWALNESGGNMEWLLRHHVNLEALSHRLKTLQYYDKHVNRPWTIVDDRSNNNCEFEMEVQGIATDEEDEEEQIIEWNSDDDDILDIRNSSREWGDGVMDFLGFHPYKEVVFLSESFNVVAYHLASSKAQYLGVIRPWGYGGTTASLYESYPYTPCLIDSLPENGHWIGASKIGPN